MGVYGFTPTGRCQQTLGAENVSQSGETNQSCWGCVCVWGGDTGVGGGDLKLARLHTLIDRADKTLKDTLFTFNHKPQSNPTL